MKSILLIFFLLNVNSISSQVTEEWVTTYNGVGIGDNVPKKSAVDKFGNIIVAGRSSDSQYDDFITLKYNSAGNLIWSRRYNGIGNNNDRIEDMLLDDSDNVYVTGESYEGPSGGTYNWVTIKYKPNGDTAWKRSFGWTGGGLDRPSSMIKDKLNNIYITGVCLAYPPYNDDMVTIKYNSDGELQWARSYSSVQIGSDWGYSISADDSNNVYSSGYGFTGGNNEIVTIKYNTAGDEIWIRKYPTYGGDYLRPVKSATDKFNNIIVNGFYYITGDYEFITLKYNSTGDLLWYRIYKGDGNLNFCFALCTDNSANVYAAGRSTSAVTGNDFVTIKYNQFGDTSWIRVQDGGDSLSDEIRSMVVDSSENVYVTGRCQSSTIAGLDYLTIKYNSNGSIIWEKKYNGVGIPYMNDLSYTISNINYGSVVIAGYSEISNSNSGIVTIKYSTLTDISNSNINNKNLKFSLSQNYPNPFNPSTKISFTLNEQERVKIVVYNIEGKKITTIIDRKYDAGEYNVMFDSRLYGQGNDLAAGIYFYSLTINNSVIDTKKMILMK